MDLALNSMKKTNACLGRSEDKKSNMLSQKDYNLSPKEKEKFRPLKCKKWSLDPLQEIMHEGQKSLIILCAEAIKG